MDENAAMMDLKTPLVVLAYTSVRMPTVKASSRVPPKLLAAMKSMNPLNAGGILLQHDVSRTGWRHCLRGEMRSDKNSRYSDKHLQTEFPAHPAFSAGLVKFLLGVVARMDSSNTILRYTH
jgi:hypothetical protein